MSEVKDANANLMFSSSHGRRGAGYCIWPNSGAITLLRVLAALCQAFVMVSNP
ncbi:hypothetical protein BDV18DRAFT_132411 [Aspergillus unguis]